MQALIVDNLSAKGTPDAYRLNGFKIDPQSYLPLQLGRLSATEAAEIIAQGRPFIPAFLEATKKQPLYYAFGKDGKWLEDLLKAKGVHFTANSGSVSSEEKLKMYYKTLPRSSTLRRQCGRWRSRRDLSHTRKGRGNWNADALSPVRR